MSTAFYDTNIFVYALDDSPKGRRARDVIDTPGRISAQTLNEFANVGLRKLRLTWPDLDQLLAEMRERHGPIIAVTEQLHQDATRVARRYRLSIYDASLVAAALTAGCDTLYSEDMHHGLVIDDTLTIVNPFA